MQGATTVQEWFASFTLGNIGQDMDACGESNLSGMGSSMTISCSYGRLHSLVAYGISKSDSYSCRSLQEAEEFEEQLLEECRVVMESDEAELEKQRATMFAAGREHDAEQFWQANCVGRSQCEMPIDLSDEGPLSKTCRRTLRQRMRASKFTLKDKSLDQAYEEEVPEPVITVQALCVAGTVDIPYTGYKIPKDDFGLMIVLIDFVVVISISVFAYILEQRQMDYVDEFRRRTIQMSDFSLRVKNLPNDEEYGDNEHILKAHLWDHFQQLLAREKARLGSNK